MKFFILLALSGFVTASLFGLQPQTSTIKEIEKLLGQNSSLLEKAKGLSLAEKIDAPEINEALVKMLNDDAEGGRISVDEGMESPWLEAMHLLARRFPESGVHLDVYFRYTDKDKTAFSQWWSENRSHVNYNNNTHNLFPEPVIKENRTKTFLPLETKAIVFDEVVSAPTITISQQSRTSWRNLGTVSSSMQIGPFELTPVSFGVLIAVTAIFGSMLIWILILAILQKKK